MADPGFFQGQQVPQSGPNLHPNTVMHQIPHNAPPAQEIFAQSLLRPRRRLFSDPGAVVIHPVYPMRRIRLDIFGPQSILELLERDMNMGYRVRMTDGTGGMSGPLALARSLTATLSRLGRRGAEYHWPQIYNELMRIRYSGDYDLLARRLFRYDPSVFGHNNFGITQLELLLQIFRATRQLNIGLICLAQTYGTTLHRVYIALAGGEYVVIHHNGAAHFQEFTPESDSNISNELERSPVGSFQRLPHASFNDPSSGGDGGTSNGGASNNRTTSGNREHGTSNIRQDTAPANNVSPVGDATHAPRTNSGHNASTGGAAGRTIRRRTYNLNPFPEFPAPREPVPPNMAVEDFIDRYPNHLRDGALLRLQSEGWDASRVNRHIHRNMPAGAQRRITHWTLHHRFEAARARDGRAPTRPRARIGLTREQMGQRAPSLADPRMFGAPGASANPPTQASNDDDNLQGMTNIGEEEQRQDEAEADEGEKERVSQDEDMEEDGEGEDEEGDDYDEEEDEPGEEKQREAEEEEEEEEDEEEGEPCKAVVGEANTANRHKSPLSAEVVNNDSLQGENEVCCESEHMEEDSSPLSSVPSDT